MKIYYKALITGLVYKLVRFFGRPIVIKKFKPIILNLSSIPKKGPVVFASNHRTTLDPFFIIAATNRIIHWGALKRFFTLEDSIFNNNKNKILCYITAVLLRSIGMIPIDRGGDNFKAINEMNKYLENNCCIGIFPEGTTNKNPKEKELLKFKAGATYFAKKNAAWIQPISITWVPKELELKNRVILNFCKPCKIDSILAQHSLDFLKHSILQGIEENKDYINKLQIDKFKHKK